MLISCYALCIDTIAVIMLLIAYRASDPNEIRKLYEVLIKRDRVRHRENELDHQLQLCDQVLAYIMEDQRHSQYP